jgi:hypothetical protein
MKPDFRRLVDRFFSVAERNGFTSIRESSGALADYKQMVMASVSGTGTFPPQPAVAAEEIQPGVRYAYYEQALDRLPDFSAMTPDATGMAESIGLKPAPKLEGIALRFEGFVRAPKDGVYTFALRSNDGSRLYLDGALLVDNDGLHKAETKTAFAGLRAGWHPMTVEYFESGGSETLTLFWAGPGIDYRSVPAAALGHRP